ncbi:hybrid sensor histidine kinase/response regulator [Microbulbifer sp. 2201CG32-9]|uniref:hybrid sensor histidine kinase/response regulator n=1 Tax=Microbulbifer sp. 2201CG32-9 TaxID=3232309 RepID=UPI00345BAA0A
MSRQAPPTQARDLFALASGNEAPDSPALQLDRLCRLLDDGNCGVWEWIPETGQVNTSGHLWSSLAERGLAGIESMWSETPPRWVGVEYRQKLQTFFRRLGAGGNVAALSFCAGDPRNGEHWLRIWGTSLGSDGAYVVGGFSDLTAVWSQCRGPAVAQESALQTLAGVGDGIWEWDLSADQILLDARGWAIVGYDSANLATDACSQSGLWKRSILPDDLPLVEQGLLSHLQEKAPLDLEFRMWHRDGSIVWVRCRGRVQGDGDEGPERVVGLVQDVTAKRVALERAERDLQRQRELSKNTSELMVSLGHELRTPLNAILGYSKVVEQDQSLNPDQRQRLTEIRRAGQHLLHLVGDVMELARIDSQRLAPSMEPIQPVPLVADCMRLLEPLAETRRVNLIFEPLGWERAHICADPVRFKQVVLNLAGNAVKYNRENGRVVINFVPQAEGWLRLSILDTGRGIPKHKRSEVFEPFNRLGAEKGHIEGTGVGLAIAKRLTEAMGGRIDFESLEDQGSIFWIEFPLIGAPAETIKMPPTPVEVPPSCRILQVENRPRETERLQKMLAGFSHVQHLVAGDAVEAIFVARTRRPDVVLLDMAMPGLSAQEIARILSNDPATTDIRCVAVGDYSGGDCFAWLPQNFPLAQLCKVLETSIASGEC